MDTIANVYLNAINNRAGMSVSLQRPPSREPSFLALTLHKLVAGLDGAGQRLWRLAQ